MYFFYDCGAYCLFTPADERFQPSDRGRRLVYTSKFFKERGQRRIDPQVDSNWRRIGPILKSLPGIQVIDVGGYLGTFSIPLALCSSAEGLDIRFHSLEPGPTRDLLRINVDANGLTGQIEVYDCAASDVNGFAIYSWRSDGAVGGQIFAPDRGEMQRIVPTRTLDDFCSALPDGMLFIKLDTQGHEPKVMQGAQQIISEKRGVWLIEFLEWSANSSFGSGTFAKYLTSEFDVFDGDTEVKADEMPALIASLQDRPARMADLLLIPKGMKDDLPLCVGRQRVEQA